MKLEFKLHHAHMGNGITVWNAARLIDGDFENVAHISWDRQITWRTKYVTQGVIDYVEALAKRGSYPISASQQGLAIKQLTM